MARKRPPYLHRETGRNGETFWYVRIGHGPRIRIRGEYGSPEFRSAYHAAVGGETPPPRRKKRGVGSLAWLIDLYRESSDWRRLSPATKSQRDNIFSHIIAGAGDYPAAGITRRDIIDGRERRAATPAAANNYLKTVRALFKWAVGTEILRSDPTQGVDRAATTGDGFHVWSEEEIEKYEAHWPIGTRERLWLAVFLYTGLRRGDAACLRHDQIKNGVILMRAEKNKAQLAIPILPELQAVIDASPKGETTLISTHGGKQLTKESLGNLFREACMAAGVPGRAHGLRKAGATRAANNGATERELEAIFGWHGGRMAAHYTRAADRGRLAKQAIGKVVKPKESD